MAGPESIHQKLARVRKPHVHITYEVETGGAMEVKELPFLVGVVGDFIGNNPSQAAKALEDRKFVDIDRDNISEVMKRLTPGVNMRVENTLAGDGSEMGVQLKFDSMESFEPAQVVEQIEPLRKLLEVRNQLRDLQTHADKKAKVEELLENMLQDAEKVKQLASELNVGDGSSNK